MCIIKLFCCCLLVAECEKSTIISTWRKHWKSSVQFGIKIEFTYSSILGKLLYWTCAILLRTNKKGHTTFQNSDYNGWLIYLIGRSIIISQCAKLFQIKVEEGIADNWIALIGWSS